MKDEGALAFSVTSRLTSAGRGFRSSAGLFARKNVKE
jgi:hypothetical protein